MITNLLSGKIALILGGSQGIGFETARLFAEQGATVIMTGRTLSSLEEAKRSIQGDVTILKSDMGVTEDRDELFATIKERYGRINIAFINAAIAECASLDAVTEDFFDRHIDINYKGAFFCAQHSARLMQQQDSIIFTSSTAGIMGIQNLSVYSSTKAAIINLTKTLAADLVGQGIRVNAISPGYIETPLGMKNNKQYYDEICKIIPLENRFGMPREIANTALFLASELSSYITGENIVVDGGLSQITRFFF
jgi:NAD(P)-dependent dehydrogenase (short-subunit alcohol dehydrogenase family)